MFIFSALSFALWVIEVAVIVRVVGGLLGVDPSKPWMKALHTVTEPLFQLVRPIARKIPGSVDWTPAILIVGLALLRRVL